LHCEWGFGIQRERERERDKRVYAAELIDDDAYICGFT